MPRRAPPPRATDPKLAVVIWTVRPNAELPPGLQLVASIDVSGDGLVWRRRAFLTALARMSESGAGVLFVAEPQLVRTPVDRAVLIAATRMLRATLVGLDSSDAGDRASVPEIVDAMEEFASMMHSVRIRVGRRVKPEASARAGDPPFGYSRVDGKLVENRAELKALTLALALQRQGLTLRAIGDRLLAEGHAPRRGPTWAVQAVSNLLARGKKKA